MREIAPGLYLGNAGEFGSSGTLRAAGITLAIIAEGAKGFPHDPDLVSLAVTVHDHGRLPPYVSEGLVSLIRTALATPGARVAVCDSAGGLRQAAFLAVAALRGPGRGFEDAEVTVRAQVPDIAIPEGLRNHGRALWPGPGGPA